MIAGSVYTILAFIGFEAAAPLAEEAKDPRRTIRLAVLYSCLGIGLFYVAHHLRVPRPRFGPTSSPSSRPRGTATLGRAGPRGLGGRLRVLVFLAVANSAIAATPTPRPTPATRTWFAMGRIRLLPRS